MCTFYKGVLFGLTLINYKDPFSKTLSFKGIGVFNNGVLHDTPFLFINGYGDAKLFSRMIDGRPADKSYSTWFCEKKAKMHVYSLQNETLVSGCQFFSGQVNMHGERHGFAKKWSNNGSIYLG